MPTEPLEEAPKKPKVPNELKDFVKVVKKTAFKMKIKKPKDVPQAKWEDEKFWMVLLKGGGNPTFKHPTLASAYSEAVRLSKGFLREAVVLEVIGRTSVQKPL